MDLIVAMSNCSRDLNPWGTDELTPLRWEIPTT